jgi:hypothetical protein
MSMKQTKNCTICKHYGSHDEDLKGLEMATIYDELGNKVILPLCREHSIDLFKQGQRKFLMSHYKILIDLVDTDNKKFIDVLRTTVKKNANHF